MTDALISAARSVAADADLAGPLVLVETAAALAMPSPGRDRGLADARRRALEIGLPRVPLALRTLRAPRLLVTERAARLEVLCFGPFRMRVDGADADLRGVRPQAREVLRILSLAAGAPLHRELLADLVWGNLGGASAVHALHVSVSSIRRMVPAGPAGGVIVERVGDTYRIAIAGREDCDLASFDDRLTEAANAKRSGDAVAARDGLADALDLYGGDILPEDGSAEWVVGTRERYRMRAGEAANSLAHLHARLGDVGEAVLAARRAVEIDPWIDASWRTLIAMHHRAGDVIEVRRAEDGYRRMRLALGVD
jgi:DNA-binding SARP family transcriptional activator